MLKNGHEVILTVNDEDLAIDPTGQLLHKPLGAITGRSLPTRIKSKWSQK